jgi:hypothetical protein
MTESEYRPLEDPWFIERANEIGVDRAAYEIAHAELDAHEKAHSDAGGDSVSE